LSKDLTFFIFGIIFSLLKEDYVSQIREGTAPRGSARMRFEFSINKKMVSAARMCASARTPFESAVPSGLKYVT
jgi:hypothetical protein